MDAGAAVRTTLRVLCVEDSRLDADLVRLVLEDAGAEVQMDVVSDRDAFQRLLGEDAHDVILADYRLPGFDAHEALQLAAGLRPDVPFICVSGIIGEEATVELLRQGAVDIVLKDRLARLPFAVQRAMEEKAHERERLAAQELVAQAAREWRRTFDAMSDSVAVFDAGGRVLRCNRATADLTGRPLGDMLGRLCHEAFHGTASYHPDCPQRRAFETGAAETAIFEQEGRWFRATFTPELDAGGGVCGGVHVMTDVTDLKHAEQSLRESVRRQQAITDGVIAALARAVEVRDPYTAGHERRVSDLAVAIARELGLDDEAVRGIEVAARLHDVGKIVVPAEILAKPGRLAELELELVRAHARAGYDVLAPIDFSWPVAETVLQHHERLDGSGYPQALRGDEIILPARILSVADVVEAMISHRPYRPARSLDDALAEVGTGAGVRYDAQVVAAVVRLFRERGFSLGDSGTEAPGAERI